MVDSKRSVIAKLVVSATLVAHPFIDYVAPATSADGSSSFCDDILEVAQNRLIHAPETTVASTTARALDDAEIRRIFASSSVRIVP